MSKSGLINEVSLKDNIELRNLILENPGLPLVVFVSEEAYFDNGYRYSQCNDIRAHVESITLYGDCWMDEDDLYDKLNDNLVDEEEYKDLSDKEYDEMVKRKVTETEFVEAIVVYIG